MSVSFLHSSLCALVQTLLCALTTEQSTYKSRGCPSCAVVTIDFEQRLLLSQIFKVQINAFVLSSPLFAHLFKLRF